MALYNVGGHYFAGKGVELSFEKAAEYYRKAAKLAFAPAQVCVCVCVCGSSLLCTPLSVQKAMVK